MINAGTDPCSLIFDSRPLLSRLPISSPANRRRWFPTPLQAASPPQPNMANLSLLHWSNTMSVWGGGGREAGEPKLVLTLVLACRAWRHQTLLGNGMSSDSSCFFSIRLNCRYGGYGRAFSGPLWALECGWKTRAVSCMSSLWYVRLCRTTAGVGLQLV